MKFAWDTNLVDLDNKILLDENGKIIVLGSLVVQSLLMQDKKDVEGKDKFTRYNLASKVHKNESIDVGEAALIKEVVGNILTPLPVGRIWNLLEHPLIEE